MNTTVIKRVSEHGGPVVLSAGAAMLAAALVTSAHYRPEAASPRPGPTVTASQAPAPVSAPSRAPTASPSTSGPTPAGVVAVSDRGAAMPHTGSGEQSHARPAAAQASPAPSSSPAAAPCSGQVFTARLLRAACVSLGGG